MKTLANKPPVKEELGQPLVFPNNSKLEKNYNSEKQEIEEETKQELINHALTTAGQLQSVILSMDIIWQEKWQKSFNEILKNLTRSNLKLEGKTITEIIKNPELTKYLYLLLLTKANILKTYRERELFSYIQPLHNFYVIIWKDKLEESDLKTISEEKDNFSEDFSDSYKIWEENNPEKAKKEDTKIYGEQNNWTIEKAIENYDMENYWYQYNEEESELFINWKDGDFSITVPQIDKPVMKNKESTKNYVDFIKLLDELGLSMLWFYRNDIIKNLNTKIKITWLNLRDNYLWENEQIIFLNYILKSIWIAEIKSNSIKEYKEKFKEKNKMQSWWKYKNEINKKWNSYIEEIFFTKYIKKWDFDESAFITEIQKNSN